MRSHLESVRRDNKGFVWSTCGACDYCTPMPGRSNLQQAVPIALGLKMKMLLATFRRHQVRLAEILPCLEFGGAAGTLATLADTDQQVWPLKFRKA